MVHAASPHIDRVLRIVFLGDGLWATRCLDRLLHDGHNVLLLVLRRVPSDPSLVSAAAAHGVPVTRPDRINSPGFVAEMARLAPDLLVSMSYDQVLRTELLDLAPLGAINGHAGKLPDYRGRSVVNWAILNGETEIGVTVHFMDAGIDTGDIIVQETVPIDWDDDYRSVLAKLEQAFPLLLARAVRLVASGEPPRRRQSSDAGTYYGRRTAADEWVDWGMSSSDIYNKIRAITSPGPGAKTTRGHESLTLWSARYEPSWPRYRAIPGEVVGVATGRGALVKTGDSTILLERATSGEQDAVPDLRLGTRLGIDLHQRVASLEAEMAAWRSHRCP